MDKLDCINTFINVVEQGNFSQASRFLGITRNQVAKRICYLETFFNSTLFIRDTRKMYLTSSGEKLYQHSKIIMNEFEWATNELLHDQKYPEGKIKIIAHDLFAQLYLRQIIMQFMIDYPNIEIELSLEPQNSDLSYDGYDISLTFQDTFEESQLYCLSQSQYNFYATPTYFKNYGIPLNTEDLKKHNLLFPQNHLKNKISLTRNQKTEHIYFAAKMTSNSECFLLDFCKQHQGIIFISELLARPSEEAGLIQRCLTEYQAPTSYLYASTPNQKKIPNKVQIFLNYLKKNVKI